MIRRRPDFFNVKNAEIKADIKPPIVFDSSDRFKKNVRKNNQSTPNHATYEIAIITIKRMIRILYPHFPQIPKTEG